MEVRLFATLREGREKVVLMDWYNGITGYDIVSQLSIHPNDAAIFLINGHHSKLDTPLEENDTVAIFPPVGGG